MTETEAERARWVQLCTDAENALMENARRASGADAARCYDYAQDLIHEIRKIGERGAK